MMFLAISGTMFIMAAGFVSGKQAKAEFKQSLNSANALVRDTANDVSNGFFPGGADFKCTADMTGGSPNPTGGDAGQGAHAGCVFLGKVIQFGTAENPSDGYKIYTVAGRQFKATGDPKAHDAPGTFAEAEPVVFPGLTGTGTLSWGMTVTKVIKNDSTPISGIGFFGTFGNVTKSPIAAGSQTILVVPITGGAAATEPEMSTNIKTVLSGITDANSLDNPDITICLDSGSGQFGTIVMGGKDAASNNNGQRLATALKIFDSKPAIC
jgi:hypothetical protein